MSDASHPLLPAATPLLRNGSTGLQIGGVDTTDGVLLGAGGAAVATVLRGLDGRRSQRAVLADAARDGLDPGGVAAVLDRMRAIGLLVDLDAADLLAAGAGPAARARTATALPTALGSAGGT